MAPVEPEMPITSLTGGCSSLGAGPKTHQAQQPPAQNTPSCRWCCTLGNSQLANVQNVPLAGDPDEFFRSRRSDRFVLPTRGNATLLRRGRAHTDLTCWMVSVTVDAIAAWLDQISLGRVDENLLVASFH